MKKVFAFCLIMLLLPLASAIRINVPSETSEQSVLYFNVSLDDADAFNEAKVYLNNKLIVTAYASQSVATHSPNVLDAFIIDSDPASVKGLTLYMTYVGLSVGQYEIEAESFLDNNRVSEDSESITVFEAINKSFEEQVETQLNELTTEINLIKTDITNFSSNVEAVQQSLSNVEVQLQSLSEQIESKFSTLSQLQEEVNNLTIALNQEKQVRAQLEAELEDELGKKIDNPLVGLASLGQSSLAVFIGLGFLVGIIIAIVFLLKKRSSSTIYSRPEKRLPLSREKSRPESQKKAKEKDEEVMVRTKTGKWAYKGEEAKKEEERKGFKLGDLLRK